MTDRPTSNARDHGKSLISAGTDRLTSAAQGRMNSLIYVGAALALAGTGFATAATVADAASTPVSVAGARTEAVQLTALVGPARPGPAARPVTPIGAAPDPLAHPVAAARAAAPLAAAPDPLAQHIVTVKDNGPSAVTRPTAAPHLLPRHTASRPDLAPAIARPAGTQHASTVKRAVPWHQLSSTLNQEAKPAAAAHHQVPLADRLTPVGVSGPQSWMPLNQAQVANATTIVKRSPRPCRSPSWST